MHQHLAALNLKRPLQRKKHRLNIFVSTHLISHSRSHMWFTVARAWHSNSQRRSKQHNTPQNRSSCLCPIISRGRETPGEIMNIKKCDYRKCIPGHFHTDLHTWGTFITSHFTNCTRERSTYITCQSPKHDSQSQDLQQKPCSFCL